MLTVDEALDLVTDLNMIVVDEDNCFKHKMENILSSYFAKNLRYRFAVVISSSKTVSVATLNDNVYLFDSHQHRSMGGFVLKYSLDNLKVIANNIFVQSESSILYVCLISSSFLEKNTDFIVCCD